MFKIPSTVRIGYLTCQVREMPSIEAKRRAICGYFDEDSGDIEIASNLSDQMKADALLHEMLHAICLLAGTELDGQREERFVRVIASGLLAAMRDNPKVFDALREATR
jgi:Zn-dependent peptidase ImmA (M78 family)